ncbi:hypothetical protein WICMUC_001971 [Wickerhamomyces mucosus]|uniref:Amino acid transporter transmembrane domain-containing protein n=1 Tax=Wickerhamomyces mucosus TaxID=1378264 RepID=A0A9P8PSX4_9ASCO|nr:hypothetical protein WICMUC_001971 [Wickerhamomyces mucosus]
MSATTQSSIINLTKTIVGAGLLAIPFGFKAQGIFLGVSLIFLAGLASSYGLYIISKVSKKLETGQETSCFALCAITYPKLTLLFDFSIFIQCFGVAISYLILVGDLVPSLFDDYITRTQAIVLSLIIIGPLISFKKLDSLKFGSLIGLTAIAYLTLLIISHSIFDQGDNLTKGHIKYFEIGSIAEILSSFSIIIFAFTAAQNISTIINEIQDKNNLNFVILSANGIAGLLFIIVGLAGYLQFGDNLKGNIILEYDSNLISTKIGKFSLTLMVILSYPLMFHPARISLNNMIFWIESEFITKLDVEDETTGLISHLRVVPFSNKRFNILTILLAGLTYTLAISVKSFELVLALVGATGSTLICFILPGLFGYKLFDTKFSQKISLLLTIWGVSVMITSVFAILYF